MSDALITTEPQRLPARRENSKPLRVTGRLKRALDLMIWDRKSDSDAAVTTGMHVLSIRRALHLPHVLAYYKAQRQVLLKRESAANIHRLTEIRDKADNMPAVQAIRMLEEMSDETQGRSTGSVSLPGLTIQIITQSSSEPATRTIEHDEVQK